MTEAEWKVCSEPQRMLENLGDRWSHRTLRFLGCACLRLEPWAQEERLQAVVNIAERYADGAATAGELDDAYDRGEALLPMPPDRQLPRPPMRDALYLATASANVLHFRYFMDLPFEKRLAADQRREICRLVRCIFGNPFRPVTVNPAWLRWNDGTVPKIAQGIYEERAFDRMPILADALLDAGCDNEDMLSHAREPGSVHVRGCWLLDLLLQKA